MIAQEIVAFVGKDPEFWADFASYDWVALCQLYGTMMDLPKGWPMFVRDVQQFRKMLDVPKFNVFSHGEHDALIDARETKARYDVLTRMFATNCSLGEAMAHISFQNGHYENRAYPEHVSQS